MIDKRATKGPARKSAMRNYQKLNRSKTSGAFELSTPDDASKSSSPLPVSRKSRKSVLINNLDNPVSPGSESRLSPIADDESRTDFDDGSSYSLNSSCEDLY